ncbi:hypothetical protein bcCo53_001152 (plasmid) [Borrelia coriaceae]|uniref:Uncharacterized protein n=1 Tax=Borrelia coriaceae ATCC 43381 TaxID=1408429 RepID=W5SW73_9SPIR|nr:hypothetical protein [Borrelia coriaceae]AHH11142.1 Hypothetical protein BCO_0024800 [Borrelia coriaceae ATCC 43381]UPA16984.1 hypothetical protein bcCo53_001152 [Borrelia coriaceae]
MRIFNLVMGVMSCNLDGVARSDSVKKVFDSNDRNNSFLQQSLNISAKDRAFYALKTKVMSYREELQDAYDSFDLSELLLNIPFKKISPDFIASDKQDKVYAGLGYDVEVIKQLGRVLSKLDLNGPHFINIDAGVAKSLLVILNNMTDCIRTVVNFYLNDEKLSQIRANKDEVRINEINTNLEEFINISKHCMSTVKSQLMVLDSKITRESVLSGLKEIIDYEGDFGSSVSLMGVIAVTIWSLV